MVEIIYKTNQSNNNNNINTNQSSPAIDDSRVTYRETCLKEAGFTKEEILRIKEQVANLNVNILKPLGGDHIEQVAQDAVKLSEQTDSSVVFKFNGYVIVVSKGKTSQEVVNDYNAKTEAAAKAYWTPERIAQEEAKKVDRHNELEAIYPTLPKFFQDWITRQGENNYGRDGDIVIAKDAYLVASTLKAPEAVKEWYDLDYEKQIEIVPGISDGHSGFSFSQMANLAYHYLMSENK